MGLHHSTERMVNSGELTERNKFSLRSLFVGIDLGGSPEWSDLNWNLEAWRLKESFFGTGNFKMEINIAEKIVV